MIGPPQVLAEATCCDELVDAFRARKTALRLSNEAIDHIIPLAAGRWPLAAGHCDKLIGPSQTRGLSQLSLDGMLAALALKLIVVVDPDQVARMSPLWENTGRRDNKMVRSCTTRVAKVTLARAQPHVVRELGRRGGLKTWRTIDSRLRSKLMSALAKRRWHADRSASAAVSQQETAGVP